MRAFEAASRQAAEYLGFLSKGQLPPPDANLTRYETRTKRVTTWELFERHMDFLCARLWEVGSFREAQYRPIAWRAQLLGRAGD